MTPPKEELLPFIEDRHSAAAHFGVTAKTIVAWLKKYDLYEPRANYGPGKLSSDDVLNIRLLHEQGVPIKTIAEKFNVTFSTISRTIHNVYHSKVNDTACVSVVYNVENKHL